MNQPPSKPNDRKIRPRWQRWLIDLLLIVAVVLLVQWWQSRNLVPGTAPPLVGMMLNGSPYQLDPAQGPTLVHFWAEWCPVCRLEQDSIDRIASTQPVITIATSSGSSDVVSAYMREHGLSMPVLMDEAGRLARAWGVNGVPATFVIGREGEIAHASMGYSTELGLRFRLWLAKW